MHLKALSYINLNYVALPPILNRGSNGGSTGIIGNAKHAVPRSAAAKQMPNKSIKNEGTQRATIDA